MKDIDGTHIYNSPPDIIQIIPATDWYSVYNNDNGEDFVNPLSCWVLLEKAFKDGDTTRWVDGLDAGDVGRYGVEYSTELDSFKEFRYDPARRSVQTNK